MNIIKPFTVQQFGKFIITILLVNFVIQCMTLYTFGRSQYNLALELVDNDKNALPKIALDNRIYYSIDSIKELKKWNDKKFFEFITENSRLEQQEIQNVSNELEKSSNIVINQLDTLVSINSISFGLAKWIALTSIICFVLANLPFGKARREQNTKVVRIFDGIASSPTLVYCGALAIVMHLVNNGLF